MLEIPGFLVVRPEGVEPPTCRFVVWKCWAGNAGIYWINQAVKKRLWGFLRQSNCF